eukprot:TRINITY_DN70773_c0_g1_i1.p1 TRINITY_DN70773_c0_g1~~TRINITY_DN70773_c0_g1_i1.p1  ORF type:complete len:221 (+),score=26.01 TRINITY_DN70773_c0_g1_i1:100-762(+)
MSEQSPESRVLSVVVTGNKPFSVQGVADMVAQFNIKKTAVQKLLDGLVNKEKLVAKDFGKTRLYIPNQKKVPVLSSEEMKEGKDKLKELNEVKVESSQKVSNLETELRQWKQKLSREQILRQIENVQDQIKQSEKKLKGLTSGKTLIDPQEKLKVEQNYKDLMAHWRKRKNIFRSIWDNVTANMDAKQSELYEEIGIETDEANGVDYHECQQLTAKRRAL